MEFIDNSEIPIRISKNRGKLIKIIELSTRKFTDEQLINLYQRNLTDNDMSDILNVARQNVSMRRCKLNLMPKYPKNSSNPIRIYKNSLLRIQLFQDNHRNKHNEYSISYYHRKNPASKYRKRYRKRVN